MVMTEAQQKIDEIKKSLSASINMFEKILETKKRWVELSEKYLKTVKSIRDLLVVECFNCKQGGCLIKTSGEAVELLLKLAEIA